MKAFITILLALALAAVAAAVVFFLTQKDDTQQKTAAPKVEKVVYMSTRGVVDNIERRLAAKAGFPLTAKCPKKVDEAVGTTFRCSVRREGGTDRIAIATVKIRGKGGQFGWTSKPVPSATPSATPAA